MIFTVVNMSFMSVAYVKQAYLDLIKCLDYNEKTPERNKLFFKKWVPSDNKLVIYTFKSIFNLGASKKWNKKKLLKHLDKNRYVNNKCHIRRSK